MHQLDLKLLQELNVLYVEDDPLVASQTVTLLKHFFHHVNYFDNAEEAMEYERSETVHLIITDIELPGMSGLEMCEKIRKTNQQLPIFITTMHDDKKKLQQAVKLNLVDYLIKPVGVTAIKETLMASLQRMENNGMLMVRINQETCYYPLRGQLETSGKMIPLTENEIKLLGLLIKYKNQIVSRESIEYLLAYDDLLSDSAYKNIIYRLRKKVGKESLVSISGMGIKLVI